MQSIAPSTEINATTITVVEGNNIALHCNTSGKPDPVITWKRLGSSKVLSNTSLLTVENVRRPGNPDNLIQYQCTAINGVGNPAIAVGRVTVYCKSVVLGKISKGYFKTARGYVIYSPRAQPEVNKSRAHEVT